MHLIDLAKMRGNYREAIRIAEGWMMKEAKDMEDEYVDQALEKVIQQAKDFNAFNQLHDVPQPDDVFNEYNIDRY
jgi:hypothetical protein